MASTAFRPGFAVITRVLAADPADEYPVLVRAGRAVRISSIRPPQPADRATHRLMRLVWHILFSLLDQTATYSPPPAGKHV